MLKYQLDEWVVKKCSIFIRLVKICDEKHIYLAVILPGLTTFNK